LVWQNSWGFTTRSIGIMTMVHSDNKGLVLPPRVAPYQYIIVPIVVKDETENNTIQQKMKDLHQSLQKAGIRGFLDNRSNYTPGYKYNHWELKGVPIRLDFGSKDLANNTIVAVRRDNGVKITLQLNDIEKQIVNLLLEIQKNMLESARKKRDDHLKRALTFDEFVQNLDKRCIVLTPFCDRVSCEENVKERSGAKNASLKIAQDAQEKQADIVRELKAKKAETSLITVAVEKLKELKETVIEIQKKMKDEQDQQQNQNESGEKFEQLTGAAKSLCKPFDQPVLEKGTLCFQCGKEAVCWCLWGRSY